MAGNMTGRLLNNRYLIGERIGIGGMAEVYQGQDNVLGRTVAVKVMLPQYAEDDTFKARFRQEAASSANLQSPYIVNVYDWGQDADTSFIVMEFVRGSDLKTAINQRGAINQRKVAEIGSQVCQALAVAHNLDIIHRDIKPQNIMVQPDGNVKVMDFGIARAKNSVMAKTSAVLGTAHYISPEQAQGKELSPASDIYSLGVVLYEAATGKLPFDGPDAVSVALKQVNEDPAAPHAVNPDIDVALEAIILKAMSKDPQNRFATARDMRLALNDYLAGRPVNLGGFNSAKTTAIGGQGVAPIGAAAEDRTAIMGVQGKTGVDGGTGNMQQRNYVEPVSTTKKGSKKRVALILIAAIAAIAAIAGISYALLGQGLNNPTGVEVPNVVDKPLTEAINTLEDAGFEVGETEYVYSDTAAPDTVLGQTPRAGTVQEQGTVVTLSVSQGAEQVEVPDLSNKKADEARAELKRLGLNAADGPAEHSDTVKENRVLRQEPEAGTKVDKGSTVTYYLSAGVESVEVPDVTNLLEGEAQTKLQNAGFQVNIDRQTSSLVPEGQVVSQSPKANTQAKKGSSVSIVVSTGAIYHNASAYVDGVAGGTVSPDYTSVADGDSVTFYITTNPGYKITLVTDSNGNSYGTQSMVTINNVHGDVSLAVSFEKEEEPEPETPSNSSTSTNTNTDTTDGTNTTGNTDTTNSGASTTDGTSSSTTDED